MSNFIVMQLECFNCRWVRGVDIEQKVLFRAG